MFGIMLTIGMVAASTMIYKYQNRQKEKIKSSPPLSIVHANNYKSSSSANTVSSQLSSVLLSSLGSQVSSTLSSNFNNAISNNGYPAEKSSSLHKKPTLGVYNKTPQGNNNTNKTQKIAYLTFDDGPSKLTPKILDVLKSKNVKGTFFVIGKDNDKSNEMLRRMVREGHTIGVHSWSHNYQVIYGSETGFLNDFNRLRNHIYKVTGVQPNICRFPGGLNNTICLKYGGHIMPKLYSDVIAMGMKPFDWNVAAHDASKVSPAKELILYNILSGCTKYSNAVILLHDTNLTTTTLEALPEIIDNLSIKGYIFKTLSPSSPNVLFNPA